MKQLYNLLARNTLLSLALLIWLEGLVFNVLYWLEPSSAQNAWLGGFSRERLLLGGGVGFVMLLLSLSLVTWIKKPLVLRNVENKLAIWISNPVNRQAIWLVNLLFAGFGTLALILGWSPNRLLLPSIYFALFAKLYPFLLWAILSSLQILFYALFKVRRLASARFNYTELGQAGFVSVCIAFILIQLLMLASRFQPPYFFEQFVWTPTHNTYTPIHYIILLLWIISGAILFFRYQHSFSTKKILLLLITWFYLAQLLIPMMHFPPRADALDRYLQAPISHVLYSACSENPGYARTLSDYDTYVGQDFWLGTKPAGYLLFYSVLKDFSVAFSQSDCHSALAYLILWLFPLLSALPIVFVYKISRELYGHSGVMAGLLLFCLPNIMFFSLVADQALFPLLFTASLWLSIKVSRQKKNIFLAVLLGCLLYLDIFLSFSLLPALGFSAIWLLLNLFSTPEKNHRLTLFKQGIVAGAAFLVLCFLVWGLSGYAPWERYLGAFSNHRAIKQIEFFSSQTPSIILLNHFEFFFWSGLVIFPLLLKNLIAALKEIYNRHISQAALFNLTLLLVWVVLNLAGQTKGEVGRLWLFVAPALMLLAADAVRTWPRHYQFILVLGQMLGTALFFQVYYTP